MALAALRFVVHDAARVNPDGGVADGASKGIY